MKRVNIFILVTLLIFSPLSFAGGDVTKKDIGLFSVLRIHNHSSKILRVVSGSLIRSTNQVDPFDTSTIINWLTEYPTLNISYLVDEDQPGNYAPVEQCPSFYNFFGSFTIERQPDGRLFCT